MHWGGKWGTTNATWVLPGDAKSAKEGGKKKESQLAAISIDGDHPRGTQAALACSHEGSQECVTCFVGGFVISDSAGKVDLRQSQVGVQAQHGDSGSILGLPGSSKHH